MFISKCKQISTSYCQLIKDVFSFGLVRFSLIAKLLLVFIFLFLNVFSILKGDVMCIVEGNR